MQKKIDLEIKMREGTSKLLSACEHMNQSLEAAKSLLTSDIRLAEFRNELQKRKSHKSKYGEKISSFFFKLKITQIFYFRIKKSSISSAKASISGKSHKHHKKQIDQFKIDVNLKFRYSNTFDMERYRLF